jgi:endo-1,4-beta-xylanase
VIDKALSRREALAGLSALSLAACAGGAGPAATPPTPGEGLHAIAQRKGLRFGSAIAYGAEGSDSGSIGNPDYRTIVERECGLVVAENEMKWQAIRPGPDQYNFAAFDAIVRYAKSKGLDIRGHTLLWHRPKWLPEWVNNYDYGARPATEAARLITSHIETVTRRYRGVIHSYDVVNELFDDKTGAFVDTSMSKAMGSHEAVVDLAFHTARTELPDAELVYNDYMSWEPGHANHRAGVLRLLEGFRKRGVPCDALGIQSHIEMRTIDRKTGIGPYDLKEWRAFCDAVTGMGYRLLLTEFDVKDNGLPADHAARDAGVANYTRAYMEVILAYPQLRDILAWGMVDKYSWLQGFAPRADGLPQRCCPYGDDYRPHPMRAALAELFAGAAPRT